MTNRNAPVTPADTSLSRRGFMKAATIAGAVAGSSLLRFPAILRAEDKAGAKPIITGSGDHTFEWVDNWAKLPEGKKFGNTHAVIESADGRIFVHNASPTGDATCIFDPDGKFIKSWGPQFKGGAHGMDLRKEGNEEFLYLAPTGMHKAFKTTLDGEVIKEFDCPTIARNDKGELCYADHEETDKKTGNKHLKHGVDGYVPTFTAFAPNGDFYITDGYGLGYIHRYNIKGEYQNTFGGKGDADNKTACPHGIYCDTRDPNKPMIVVADREHHRLQYFTLDGKLDHLVTNDKPEENSNDNGKLRRPCHFSQRGTEMVIPDLRGRVTILDKDNNAVAQLGDNPNPAQRAVNAVKQSDTTPGHFCCPHGATWDSHGNIFVVEWLPYGRVTKLKKV